MIGSFPLSPLQLGAYWQYRIDPADPRYLTGLPFRVRGGAVSVAHLRDFWGAAIERHAAMRTTFGEANGVPFQIVGHGAPAPFVEHDVRGWTEARVQTKIVELHRAPVDIERASPYELHVLHRAGDDVTILMRSHHIVVDLTSEDLLFAEMRDAITAGRASAPVVAASPPPPLTYRDFVERERAAAEGGAGEAGLRFWEEALRGAPTTVDLPFDYEAGAPARGGSFGFELLDADRAARLRALCAAERTTVFRALFTAFAAFLYRHTGQDDLVVGAPADCRGKEFADVVGDFVNVMPIRARVLGGATFLELLRTVGADVTRAVEHRRVPFASLVERLRPPREPGRAPIVQTSFNMTRLRRCRELEGILWPPPGPPWRGRIADLDVENEPPVPAQEGHFELALAAVEVGPRFVGEIKYDRARFAPETVARLARRFAALLDGVLADASVRVDALPLLPEDERHAVVSGFNATARPFDDGVTVCSLIEAQVQRSKDAVAVAHGDASITYGELDARAALLARRLRAAGAGEESIVALHLPRSIDFIVAIFATLKAGAAFLPLDLAVPDERIATMLDDARPAVVVTLGDLEARLPAACPRVCLDRDATADAGATAVADGARGSARDGRRSGEDPSRRLAYVIYTSGSTGRPKGVEIEHRGVCNLAAALARAWELDAASRLYAFASFAFDASVADVFPTLVRGASLHLGPLGDPPAGAALLAFLARARITHVTLPPAVWASMPDGELSDLRVAVSAGEACLPEVVARWAPGRVFFNNYGPTESTVCTTIGRCVAREDAASVGSPIDNLRTYVLGPSLEPAPIGVVGELYLAGVGVARGYRGSPELTRERFVDDPFTPGERMYRTGDRARWRAAGGIEVLGRVDTQVKLRGMRIELGDVEAALRADASVADACVVVAERDGGRRALVAYVVPAPGEGVAIEPLRARAARTLPAYMVPQAIVPIDALPLTTNGKVDRRALAARGLAPASDGEGAAGPPPDGHIERAIALVWSRLLRLPVERIARSSDFYALGGDSLVALLVAHEIRSTLGLDASAGLLHASRTLAAYARALDEARGDLVTLRAAGAARIRMYLLPAAGGDATSYSALARSVGDDIQVVALRARDGESLVAMARAYAEVIARDAADGPLWLGGWSMGGVLAYEVARELHDRGRPVSLVVLLDARLPRASGPTRAPTFMRMVRELGASAPRPAGRTADELEALATSLLGGGGEGDRLGHAGARIRAHAVALEEHEVKEPIAVDLLTVWSRHTVGIDAVTPWSALTRGGIEEVVVDGDHDTFLEEPRVSAVADAITRSVRASLERISR